MRGDGAWAGNIEVQAASLLLRSNIAIHQAGQPPWVVVNWPGDAALHLAYEGELHYDSVRRARRGASRASSGSPLGAAPRSLRWRLLTRGARHPPQAGDTSAGPGGPFSLGSVPPPGAAPAPPSADEPAGLDEVLCSVPPGAATREAAAQALRDMDGDMAAAVEFLIGVWGGGGAEEEPAAAQGEARGAAVAEDNAGGERRRGAPAAQVGAR